ncbi:polysaccharide deacetylase family protein [Holophaga foetida]|uniref:polysaccharide deacetylase family protein n=1 Tax=Holophaga foetida TaxID=35839 RepID=UPI00130E2AC2|nr:polysaccharide deacetylase family protein [Holophaga foetida]
MRDLPGYASYIPNILGEREAIPAMLDLFRRHRIETTWATVGFVFHRTRRALMEALPAVRPAYGTQALDPYAALAHELGQDEASDPLHFGADLLDRILDTPGQEVGCHTYSHFYCFESLWDPEAFDADLRLWAEVAGAKGIAMESLVFPRNQYDSTALGIARSLGISSFRGNRPHWIYRVDPGPKGMALRQRVGRLVDVYLPVSGHQTNHLQAHSEDEPLNLPASAFLKPFSSAFRPLDSLKLARIKRSMTDAARRNGVYHLWWHPHNFGRDLSENIAMLEEVLTHFAGLQDRFGMQNCSMANLAKAFSRLPARP